MTGLLFPRPVADTDPQKQKIVELFGYLSTFIAMSLLDSRIVDFRFSKVFFQLSHQIASGEFYMEYNDIEDEVLYCSLECIYNNKDNRQEMEEMCLTFVLSGLDIEIVENDSKLNIHVGNVTQYKRSIISNIIDLGVKDHIKSFVTGFSKVFSYSILLIFTPEKLVESFGRVEED